MIEKGLIEMECRAHCEQDGRRLLEAARRAALSKSEMRVRLHTDRLTLKSVDRGLEDEYLKLFTCEKNMEMYLSGETKSKEWVEKVLEKWSSRWEQGDTLSAFAIYLNDEQGHERDTFIGHVVAGYGDTPGESQFAIVIDHSYCRKGFGKEVLKAILTWFVPTLRAVTGVRTVAASAHPDNVASWKIMEALGLVQEIPGRTARKWYTKPIGAPVNTQ